MKKLLFLLFFLPIFTQAQTCVKVDSIYSTAKVRELGNRNIKFGIKQIAEDYLSEKYCLSSTGESIWVEVYYFGLPKKTLRIAGVEKTDQITQVGIRLYYKGVKYDGRGESETEIRAMLLEVQEGSIPFEKMTVSSAIKKAIGEAISKLP
ncbi:hypothetical protein UFOVP331_54 [uncultured Caudovirales phage]|uniref:Uncharacterized protein n=1 Tax=uncultured Caudovirales phage TaxID=2100421 RepID=A0A6J5LX62_9CAUD|nr:hypothetical protein UFOVP331_54 [uncultured Caudovirales phage]